MFIFNYSHFGISYKFSGSGSNIAATISRVKSQNI